MKKELLLLVMFVVLSLTGRTAFAVETMGNDVAVTELMAGLTALYVAIRDAIVLFRKWRG